MVTEAGFVFLVLSDIDPPDSPRARHNFTNRAGRRAKREGEILRSHHLREKLVKRQQVIHYGSDSPKNLWAICLLPIDFLL
jgi:hypothetical protein